MVTSDLKSLYEESDALQLVAHVRAGDVTAAELVEAAITRSRGPERHRREHVSRRKKHGHDRETMRPSPTICPLYSTESVCWHAYGMFRSDSSRHIACS